MALQVTPTKGSLINTKKSLELSKLGFELLDKKRNILVKEMMTLIDHANKIQSKIDSTYQDAYDALRYANITLGFCSDIASTVPVENSLQLSYHSVMGVEIPILTIEATPPALTYGLYSTNTLLDDAYSKFHEVKLLTTELAEIENSIYRLANAIKKTQKRANALRNIMIPRFEETVKFISDSLDEKEREEFIRLKVIKNNKEQNL